MWCIALKCDGCGEPLAWMETRPGHPLKSERPARIVGYLRREAERRGWERVAAFDGEEWFCPTCRRARDGHVLAGEVARTDQP